MISPFSRHPRLALATALGACMGWMPAGAATQDSFQPVGKLVEARDGERATLLNDGTVLVTGGYHFILNEGGPIASAERFDPATNRFTALPSMAVPREDSQRTVLLKDGRVLIVSGGASPLIEIFNPATNQFITAGEMLRPRGGPSATLLPDGRVLIAAGFTLDPFGPSITAELFDPVSGKSQPTGDMRVRRYRHAAVVLPDGRVVLLGGYDPENRALSSIEIYDPRTGTFAVGGNLVEARADMTAHLVPDGRILVVAGLFSAPDGGEPSGARKSVEIYDPATGQSEITDALPDAPWFHAAAPLADGRLLVAGGGDLAPDGKGPLNTAVLVEPQTGKVSVTAPMAARRVGPAAVTLQDGRVLIIGGANADRGGRSSLDTAEVYIPAAAAD
jgi:hypothetical protein